MRPTSKIRCSLPSRRQYRALGAVVTVMACAMSGVSSGAQSPDDQGIRGVVKARQEAVISVDIKASILKLPVRSGESFNKGDLLIAFDCKSQQADAAAARASYEASKSRYESNVEMNSYDALGTLDVNLAKAEMDEASARMRAAEARNRQCRIVAPYAGRVAELTVNAFEMPAPDTPLMKIVGSKQLELRLIVPSMWLNWLEVGATFEFAVDETAQSHEARVTNVGAEVDAVSRTVAIIASFSTPPETVLPGMSGTARFTQAQLAQSDAKPGPGI